MIYIFPEKEVEGLVREKMLNMLMGSPVAVTFKKRGSLFCRPIFRSLWSAIFDHFNCIIQRI